MSMNRRAGRRPGRGGASGGLWTPKRLPGLDLWLRADMGITISTGVSAWADQSGTGDANKNAVQAVPGNQPTFNASDAAYGGRPTLSFASASSQFLASGVWSTPPSATGTDFTVGNTDNGVATQVMSCFSNGSTNGAIYMNTTDDMRYFQGVDLLFTGAVTLASPHVYTAVHNGASTKVYQDQNLRNTGNAGAGALDRVIVGSYTTTGLAPLNGKIAEIISYNRVLSDGEVAQVQAYLKARYGTP